MSGMKMIGITEDIQITDVALGLGGLGVLARQEECFRVMDQYLEAGGNVIDTARMYAGGETDLVLGRWLKSRGCREKVVLCTKGCFPSDSRIMHRSRLSPTEIRRDLEENLRAIGVDWADLYLLHRDDINIPVGEIVAATDRLVREGKVKAVGVSNWTAARIQAANDFARANGLTPFTVSEIMYSLAVTTPAATGDLTHIAINDVEYGWYLETGFPVIAYSAQAKGFFSRHAAGREQKAHPQQYFGYFPENLRRADRVKELSRELGRDPASVALAYVRASALNVSALIAFSAEGQLPASLEALEFALTPEQVRYLETGK